MSITNLPIAVLGAGSWGTALALVLSRNGCQVRLWDHDQNHILALKAQRNNARYLPGHTFPDCLTVCINLVETLENVRDILVVVPSHAFTSLLTNLKSLLPENARIASASKGIDPDTNHLFHQIAAEVLGNAMPVAILSGPSFAGEVAQGLPTAISLASTDESLADFWAASLHCPHFRVYKNPDLIGVQLCGTVKNVLAIAAGIADGLNLGANSRCAMITRGIAELGRLVQAMGGQQQTVMGLAGVGDLVLTCTDNQSRNRRFGLAIGQGADRSRAEAEIGQVVEGLYNTRQVYNLSKQYGVRMPIVHQVYRTLFEGVPAKQAVSELLESTAVGVKEL